MRNTPDPKQAAMGDLQVLALDEIKPYWRNPRRVTDEAVNALAGSVYEYGYQQPIVVDSDHVIIVGHTRYAALRRMDIREVPVLVATSLTPEQVKQYRLIDNKSGEMSSWDYEALAEELDGVEAGLATQMFPEIVGDDLADAGHETVATEDDPWDRVVPEVTLICPSCFHSWEMTVTREALLSGVLRVEEEKSE